MRGLLFILTYLSISCNDYLGMHGKKKASDLPLQTCWSNSLLSDQQSPDTEIEPLCSQLFAYPNESHLLSPQGRSSNESVLLPRAQGELGVRMVNPGCWRGWDWHRVQRTGHWQLGLLVSWGESAKAGCADSCGYLPQEQGWALSASSNSWFIPERFALKFF